MNILRKLISEFSVGVSITFPFLSCSYLLSYSLCLVSDSISINLVLRNPFYDLNDPDMVLIWLSTRLTAWFLCVLLAFPQTTLFIMEDWIRIVTSTNQRTTKNFSTYYSKRTQFLLLVICASWTLVIDYCFDPHTVISSTSIIVVSLILSPD